MRRLILLLRGEGFGAVDEQIGIVGLELQRRIEIRLGARRLVGGEPGLTGLVERAGALRRRRARHGRRQRLEALRRATKILELIERGGDAVIGGPAAALDAPQLGALEPVARIGVNLRDATVVARRALISAIAPRQERLAHGHAAAAARSRRAALFAREHDTAIACGRRRLGRRVAAEEPSRLFEIDIDHRRDVERQRAATRGARRRRRGPSGWRSSAPAPTPMAIGRPPMIAAMVVIMIGRKRRRQAS